MALYVVVKVGLKALHIVPFSKTLKILPLCTYTHPLPTHAKSPHKFSAQLFAAKFACKFWNLKSQSDLEISV